MATIRLTGEPVPKGRPRLGKHGAVYTPARTQQATEAIRWQLLQQKVKPVTGDLRVDLVYRVPTRRRSDLDNFIKQTLDSANGFAWDDDAQIVELHARLERGHPDPGTDLTITPLEAVAWIRAARSPAYACASGRRVLPRLVTSLPSCPGDRYFPLPFMLAGNQRKRGSDMTEHDAFEAYLRDHIRAYAEMDYVPTAELDVLLAAVSGVIAFRRGMSARAVLEECFKDAPEDWPPNWVGQT